MTDRIAVAFFAESGVYSLECAIKYAGAGGRLLTLPEVCSLRAKSDIGNRVWARHFTTASSEFFGLSRSGVPVVAVMHGGGPLLDPGFLATSFGNGSRIEQSMFLDILDGKFGEVEVVDFQPVTDAHQYPFAPRTAEEILTDKLWVARLGGLPAATDYVMRHAMVSLAVREAENAPFNGTHAGPIIQMDEPSVRYTTIVDNPGGGLRYAPKAIDGTFAHGHLLVVGAAVRTSMGNPLVFYISDVGLLNSGDASNFVVADGETVDRIVNIPDIDDAHRSIGSAFLVERRGASAMNGIVELVRSAGDLFAKIPADDKGGAGLSPLLCHRELSTVAFRQKPIGYHGFFKYDLKDVAALAPDGANAFRFGGVVLDGSDQCAPVTFYEVTVDTGRRLPTMEEIMADPAAVRRVIAAAA